MHVFIDVPAPAVDVTRDFWARALGWPPGEPWPGHSEFVSLQPADGDPYVHIQQIGGDPRVHIDVVVDDLDRVRDRVVEIGGRAANRMPQWQVMASPGGLPFCLCRGPATGTRPTSASWPGGHRSRLVQVCIDVPEPLFDAEVSFWQSFTRWSLRASEYLEFRSLVGPERCPIRLLLQRLGPDDQETTTRAHIDLGASDVDAEAERLIGLGARYVDGTHSWIVLADPIGQRFCVTGRPPD